MLHTYIRMYVDIYSYTMYPPPSQAISVQIDNPDDVQELVTEYELT